MQTQQTARVPLCKVRTANQFHILRRKPQQTQLICHRRLCFPHFARGFLLRQSVLINQTLEAIGFLEKIQITPLQVLHERNRRGIFVIRRNQQTRYIVKPRNTRRAQPSLPCHKLITASGSTPYGQRIEYAILPDALCQLRNCLRIKVFPRLIGIARNLTHANTPQRAILFSGNQC